MRAAVALRDVVGEDQHVLVVGIVPPQGDFDGDAVALAAYQHRLADQRALGAVEIAHEGFEPALVEQVLRPDFGVAGVGEDDMDAGIEEGQFAQSMFDGRIIEFGVGKGLGARQEGHRRAALGLAVHHRRLADHFQRRDRLAMSEMDLVLQPVAPDAQVERRGQGVDDRDADAVQAAGNLVGILVEFPAGVQLGHDHFGRRDAFLRVQAGRDAAPVVGDGAGAVGVERHGDEGGVAGERLVDGVVHHFIDHVMEA